MPTPSIRIGHFFPHLIEWKHAAMAEKEFLLDFKEHIERPLRKNILLSNYSSFRIGGKADYCFEAASVSELKTAILLARQHSIPYYVIGGGYNLLFADDGFRGLIIRNRAHGIRLRGGSEVEVLSGTPLSEFIHFLEEKGLSGLEFSAGIPGTVGGAIFGNAGAFNHSLGEFLKEAVLLDERGEERTVQRSYFKFQYRQSSLREKHHTLLQAIFTCRSGEREEIRRVVEQNLKARERRHPPENTACAGSYFKNPVLPDGRKVAAGELLEEVGAKGFRVGGAAVYPGHANFILNCERAKASDVLSLARVLKERVREKFGVELEEEVIFLPATSSMP